MRLLLIDSVPLTYGGGYERFLLYFGRIAALRGHQVLLLTPRRDTGVRLGRWMGVRVKDVLSDDDVAKGAYPARVKAATLHDARALAADADFLYLKNEPQELALAWLLRGRRVKLVVGLHSATEGRPGVGGRMRASIYRSFAYKHLARQAAAFHALQPYQSQFLERELGISPSRIWVVPNGIDLERFVPPSARHRDGTFRILLAGRLDPQKGTDIFLRSLDRIRVRNPSIAVTVAGDGPLKPMVESAVARVSDMSLLGYVSDPAGLYASHDLLVAPSRWEVFPLVPCEALACGLPVVLSDIPANRVFQDTDATALCRTDDAEDLAATIINRFHLWLNDPEAYDALRHSARQFAEERLDQRVTFASLIANLETENDLD